jgi:D-alanine-D-alanine ligase
MKVAVVHNLDNLGVINRFGQICPEEHGEEAITAVVGALQRAGHHVLLCEGDKTLLQVLERFMPPSPEGDPTGIVFNMAYGIQGNCRYSHVPAMLEMAGVPYTGSDPLGHALALDKVIAKDLLRQAGIPTPNYCAMKDGDDSATGVRFPVIVKPRHESTSFGLRLVTDPEGLRDAVNAIVQQYQQDALVEEYVDGREFSICLLGNGSDIEVLPLVEQGLANCSSRLMTWENKSHRAAAEPYKICPANVSKQLEARLREISLATFRACHCRDYARVDIRMDEAGNPYVLQINPMASLGLTGSYVLAAHAAGYTMDSLFERILDVALRRCAPLPETLLIVVNAELFTNWRRAIRKVGREARA